MTTQEIIANIRVEEKNKKIAQRANEIISKASLIISNHSRLSYTHKNHDNSFYKKSHGNGHKKFHIILTSKRRKEIILFVIKQVAI